jgi:transcriptional regulator with XRE-family HTH domain
MDSTFGGRLRSQREQQQVSLTTIAERTKIKLSLLEALERDDLTHWPHGIFGRSYIRAYAEAIGLDPDATLREFAERHLLEPQAPLTELRDKTAERSTRRPPTRLQFLIDSAIDAFHSKRAELNQKTSPSRPHSPAAASLAPAFEPPMAAPIEAPTEPRIEPPIEQLSRVDFLGLARLCAKLSCAQHVHELTSVLEDASSVLDSVGLILWIPDGVGLALIPAFAYGYPDEMIAQLPGVPLDAPNAIAEAFGTRSTCIVNGAGTESGAVVTPLLTPTACSGVLSLEFRDGSEQRDDVRAGVMLLAAQVSMLVGYTVLAQTRSA